MYTAYKSNLQDRTSGPNSKKSLKTVSVQATRWTAEERPFDSQQVQEIFIFSEACRPAVGPHPPSYSMCTGSSFAGIKRPKPKAHYAPLLRLRISGALTPLPLTPSRHTQLPPFNIYECHNPAAGHSWPGTSCSKPRAALTALKTDGCWFTPRMVERLNVGICHRTSCNMWLESPITPYLHIPFNSRYVPMSPG